MEISKTQPMRSAEIQLIDEVNAHESAITILDGSVDDLVDDLSNEVQTRADADTALVARIDGTNAIIPANYFTSTDTVKKYVDDADTAIEDKIGSGFDSTNTVKKYVDDADTAIEDKIGSGFNSTNTVAKAISDLNTLLGSATPYMSPIIDAINDLNTRVTALESA